VARLGRPARGQQRRGQQDDDGQRTNINVYRNDREQRGGRRLLRRFGHHDERPRRIDQAEARQLTPVRGPST
jgi:hypothetical protein